MFQKSSFQTLELLPVPFCASMTWAAVPGCPTKAVISVLAANVMSPGASTLNRGLNVTASASRRSKASVAQA